jgi:hypothetical protein
VTRTTWWCLGLSLAGCGDEAALNASLPVEQAAPPLLVAPYGTPAQGQYFALSVNGAQPGATLVLAVSNGGVASGQGPCPAVLGGLCLDLLPGTSGVRELARTTASPMGGALLGRVLPEQMPPGVYHFQVVMAAGAASEVAAPLEVYVDGAGPCEPDAYEPNNTAAQAVEPAGALLGASLCGAGDVDYWRYLVPAGAVFGLTATMSAQEGDLDLELLSSTGLLLDGSYTAGLVEEVLWFNGTGVDQVVVVRTYSSVTLGEGGVIYGLTPELIVPSVCVDDAREPDDDAGAAQLVGVGAHAGQSCLGDSDWFAIDLAAGETVQLEIDEDTTGGDVQMRVFDEALAPLVFGAVDQIVHESTSDETLFVEVLLASDDTAGGGNNYELVVDLLAVIACPYDGLEPNDSSAAAVLITPGSYLDLGACFTSADDWYVFTASAGQTIDVLLAFLHEDADVDVELYDPAGARVRRSESATDDETLVHLAATTGQYRLRVYLWGNTHDRGLTTGGAVYDLDLELR